jgi:hypothetical protein
VVASVIPPPGTRIGAARAAIRLAMRMSMATRTGLFVIAMDTGVSFVVRECG